MFFTLAHEFRNIKGWINSPPLELKQLRGKVTLLDFWTYSCVNCLRTLPHLKELYEKYQKYGLVLIGIHTPEFDFERIAENVEKAVAKHKIPYPVALDSDNTTWKLYGNQYWPRQTLVDHKGRIVWEHTGEGGYQEIEEWVQKLLLLSGNPVKVKMEKDMDIRGYLSHIGISPEMYAGSERNAGLGSSGVCGADGVCRYLDQEKDHKRDVLYPHGEWTQRREFLIHTGKEGYLLLRYKAKEVNCVLEGETDIEVFIEGKKTRKIKIGNADMYALHASKNIEEHELKIVTKGPLKVYAFTFG